MNTKRIMVLIFSVTVLVAGCGGGSDDVLVIGGGGAATGPAFDSSTATATISGSIMFDGDVPEMPRIQMAADPYCLDVAAGARALVPAS